MSEQSPRRLSHRRPPCLTPRSPSVPRSLTSSTIEKTGNLTREYYTTHQSNSAAAAERFDRMDVNKDGVVTRDEFISNGGKKLK